MCLLDGFLWIVGMKRKANREQDDDAHHRDLLDLLEICKLQYDLHEKSTVCRVKEDGLLPEIRSIKRY